MLTNDQITTLADFTVASRPDYDRAGIIAALRRCDPNQHWSRIAWAVIRWCANPDNRTPRFDLDGHHWNLDHPNCKHHPQAGIRSNGQCGTCWADQIPDPTPYRRTGVTIPPPDFRQQVAAVAAAQAERSTTQQHEPQTTRTTPPAAPTGPVKARMEIPA